MILFKICKFWFCQGFCRFSTNTSPRLPPIRVLIQVSFDFFLAACLYLVVSLTFLLMHACTDRLESVPPSSLTLRQKSEKLEANTRHDATPSPRLQPITHIIHKRETITKKKTWSRQEIDESTWERRWFSTCRVLQRAEVVSIAGNWSLAFSVCTLLITWAYPYSSHVTYTRHPCKIGRR